MKKSQLRLIIKEEIQKLTEYGPKTSHKELEKIKKAIEKKGKKLEDFYMDDVEDTLDIKYLAGFIKKNFKQYADNQKAEDIAYDLEMAYIIK